MDRYSNLLGFLGNLSGSTMGSHSCSGAGRVQARLAGFWAWLAPLPCSCITRAWGALGSHLRLWMILWLPINSCIWGWRTEVLVIREFRYNSKRPEVQWNQPWLVIGVGGLGETICLKVFPGQSFLYISGFCSFILRSRALGWSCVTKSANSCRIHVIRFALSCCEPLQCTLNYNSMFERQL